MNAARDYPELLSCHTLGYNITATTDILAINRSAVRDGLPQSGIRLLMDIKQAIATPDVNQAQARLLLGNLHSPDSRPVLVGYIHDSSQTICARHACLDCPMTSNVEEKPPSAPILALDISIEMPLIGIHWRLALVSSHANNRIPLSEEGAFADYDALQVDMAVPTYPERPVLSYLQVLTDLNDEWHAIWLDDSTIYQHTFASRGLAVGFIEDLLAGRFETCGTISQSSFAKRRKIDYQLSDSCARDAAFAQQVDALNACLPTPVWGGSLDTYLLALAQT